MKLQMMGLDTGRAPIFGEKSDPATNTVAKYLNTRLAEIGVSHVFAIPGDYIAEYVNTLDQPNQNPGNIVRVHPNNEVSATYSADGMARAVAGAVGCVAFTYGVGALNCAQAVAGAYVEQVPLVVINGSPSHAQFNSERDQGVLYHHMVDGSHTDYRVFQNITAMAVQIENPANAPELIDAALRTCITESRPVYIEIANLVALMECGPVPATPIAKTPLPQSQKSLDTAANAIFEHMKAAKRLVFVGGAEIARADLGEAFAALLKAAEAPYVTSPLGKSILAEDRSDVRFAGVYFGRSAQDNVQQLMREADCVVSLGVSDTDFNYLGIVTPDYTPGGNDGLPGPTHIQARKGAVMVGRGLAYWGDVSLAAIIERLSELISNTPLPNAPFPSASGSPWQIPPTSDYPPDDVVTWDSFKSYLVQDFLEPHGADDYPQIVADSGFSFVALSNVKAAERGYVAQLAWAAIGYGTGATTGVALAQSRHPIRRRTVTVAGDAAFAETVNALGTLAQQGQDAVVFVIDNKVYAVEQWLINADAFCPPPAPDFEPLTDVPQGHIWDYVKLAEGFGGVGHKVRTNAELKTVLAGLSDVPINPNTKAPTFTLIALQIPGTDCPDVLRWKLNCS
ncbi:MAG: thiamine pyrophosphate-binding protein [Pseudomonadota bacterium]